VHATVGDEAAVELGLVSPRRVKIPVLAVHPGHLHGFDQSHLTQTPLFEPASQALHLRHEREVFADQPGCRVARGGLDQLLPFAE
jgi:hypothetical protein